MASAPQGLPLFYNALEPLSSQAHADYKLRTSKTAPFLKTQHAIPVTVDEFAMVQRYMPIVFSVGPDAIPIALMGLNEGVNVFVDDTGAITAPNFYVPAYIRRYPYMLAKLAPDAQELSLCFDPTSDTIGKFEDGEPMFVDGQPSDTTKNILGFNEMFEQAGARTAAFMRDLVEAELLMDGEVTIQAEGVDKPYVYRGFQMVNEEKLADLRGDQLRKMTKSGMLPLLYAHLFSLSQMREIFQMQVDQGKNPPPELII